MAKVKWEEEASREWIWERERKDWERLGTGQWFRRWHLSRHLYKYQEVMELMIKVANLLTNLTLVLMNMRPSELTVCTDVAGALPR